ncbi:hypothetical protein NBO_42g0014 [Nosema bombycis CQ1]|uniref:Uncharacterized protein n=1 Tax=Nosema bombycis (strain CQ1 / CVCC 102059) TaxID=578461 RepID=R0M7Q7_NOSB1|nr:hypothetical protein NBO_42g0014 [Nosema bombycis CQ1]|eukprot:EOB14024.1 hypothetical protein NBO_42g0014 [Nosema bombycis CQ1]
MFQSDIPLPLPIPLPYLPFLVSPLKHPPFYKQINLTRKCLITSTCFRDLKKGKDI